VFQASAASKDIGINPDDLANPEYQWGTTGVNDFTTVNCVLLLALLSTEQEHWPMLWRSSVYHRHGIVQSLITGDTFYIMHVSTYMLFCYRLSAVDNETFTFSEDIDAFQELCITAWDAFVCVEYDLALSFADGMPHVLFTVTDSCHVLRFMTRHYIENLTGKTLSRIAACLGITLPKSSSVLSWIEAIVGLSGATVGEQEAPRRLA
jgi:hypothetical protein